MNNLRTSPPLSRLSSCKNLPPLFFHGAFAPSFIWRRRPWGKDRKEGRGGMDVDVDVEDVLAQAVCLYASFSGK